MKLSIITVCYNSEATIENTLSAIENQSYDNIEYIIVDGGSTDRTVELIKQSPAVTSYISEPDLGIYDAMNKGIKLATGDIVGILNSDDYYLHDDVLLNVANQFIKYTKADLLLANVDFVNASNLNEIIRTYSANYFSPWMLRFGLMPPHPATFIKKSVYESIGLYKIDYKIGADFDMFVRTLIVNHFDYIKLDETLVRMRIGGVSSSGLNSYLVSTKEIVRSLKENKVYSNLLMVLVRLPIKLFQMKLF